MTRVDAGLTTAAQIDARHFPLSFLRSINATEEREK